VAACCDAVSRESIKTMLPAASLSLARYTQDYGAITLRR
jgi:hypothetical protein